VRSLSCSRYDEDERACELRRARRLQSDAPKTRAILPRPGEPPREWRACRDAARRGGCIAGPPLYKSQSIYSIQRQHSFSDARTREREGTTVNPPAVLPPPQQPLSHSDRRDIDSATRLGCNGAAMEKRCMLRLPLIRIQSQGCTLPSTSLRRVPSAESRMMNES